LMRARHVAMAVSQFSVAPVTLLNPHLRSVYVPGPANADGARGAASSSLLHATHVAKIGAWSLTPLTYVQHWVHFPGWWPFLPNRSYDWLAFERYPEHRLEHIRVPAATAGNGVVVSDDAIPS